MGIRADTDDLISFLNSLVALDPGFVRALLDQRVPCNGAITHHPTVQVGTVDGIHVAGILGVLNGYLGTFDDGPRAGWGPIMAVFGPDGCLSRFERTG